MATSNYKKSTNKRGSGKKCSVSGVLTVIVIILLAFGVACGTNGKVNPLHLPYQDITETFQKGDSSTTTSDGNASTTTTATATATGQSGSYQWTEWNEQYPDAYRIVGNAVVDREVEAGTIEYDSFDSLGRTQRAVGDITKEMVDESAGWRAEFKPDVDTITGWEGNNHKVSVTMPNGSKYNQTCYNRSHLIGDSLGGYEHVYNADGSINQKKSKSEKQNLVTGTRFQNVGQDNKGGMAYCEGLVRDYLESHPDVTVYYSATPVYDGDDLVCRSVFVDIKSSDGGIDEEVEVFNVMPGCTIDYSTGVLTQD